MSGPANAPAPQQRRKWHIDKAVSVTHLFSVLAAIFALLVLGSKIDTRVTLLEQVSTDQRAVDLRQDKQMDEFKRSVREDYRAIDDKLQRLIEKAKP